MSVGIIQNCRESMHTINNLYIEDDFNKNIGCVQFTADYSYSICASMCSFMYMYTVHIVCVKACMHTPLQVIYYMTVHGVMSTTVLYRTVCGSSGHVYKCPCTCIYMCRPC